MSSAPYQCLGRWSRWTVCFALLATAAGCGDETENSPERLTQACSETATVSGRVTIENGTAVPGVTVTLSGGAHEERVTDSNGGYQFQGLRAGDSVVVRPSKNSCTFAPDSAKLAHLKGDVTRDFVASGSGCIPTVGSGPTLALVNDDPIVLLASVTYTAHGLPTWSDAEVHPTTPVDIRIPDSIPVTLGGSDNGAVWLSIGTSSHRVTKCEYRGGNRVGHPTHGNDSAAGQEYKWHHCSDGAQPLAAIRAESVRLHVASGDRQNPAGLTEVALRLGGDGVAPLADPVSKAESIALRDNFDWAATTALPEMNADGRPTLFYALVYVRSRDELQALDELYIHHDALPLFSSELSQYDGRRGLIRHAGDGTGSFVFAVMPGITYNQLRQAALVGDLVFQAVILRQPPDEAKNADGSLSYDALVKSAFLYETALSPDLPIPDDAASNLAKRRSLRDILRGIARAVQGAVRGVEQIFGRVDRAINGTVHLDIGLIVRNTDAAFGTDRVMTRAWGSDAGSPIGLAAVRVDVRQVAAGFLPTLYTGLTGEGGRAKVAITRSEKSSICITLENPGSFVTEWLLPVQLCDFGTFADRRFDVDTSYDLSLRHRYVNLLAQAWDGHEYMRRVAGFVPRKAEIMVGLAADLLGKANGGAAFTPCFGYPNPSFDGIVNAATAALALVSPGIAGLLSGAIQVVYGTADVFVPAAPTGDADLYLNSRGVMTHEYGHFALCSLLAAENPSNIPGAYTDAAIQRLQGKGEGAYINEAFADFLSGQVVGGANYFTPSGAYSPTASNPFAWCKANSSQCFDANCTEANDLCAAQDRFGKDVGRVATLLHDAFDGHVRGADLPDNADAWSKGTNDLFVYSDQHGGDARDELVSLGGDGPGLQTLVHDWNKRSARLTQTSFLAGLNDTILAAGYDWCQACKMFALHVSSVAEGASAREIYTACEKEPLAAWVGPPPDSSDPASCNFDSTIFRVSVDSRGGEANDTNQWSSISQDGEVVAFRSAASNLVANDTDGKFNVFVKNRRTGAIERADVSSSGEQQNSYGSILTSRAVDATGRFVAFESYADNLVSGDSDGQQDCFVRDTVEGTTTIVSVASDGSPASLPAIRPSISRDGRYVAFTSWSRDLEANGYEGVLSIYLHDLVDRQTRRVSVSDAGAANNLNSDGPVVTSGGRYVVYASYSTNLVAGDANDAGDIFLRDRALGHTSLVSVSSSGIQANGESASPDISDDGRFVVFESDATNLAPGDTNGATDVFLHDTVSGETTQISHGNRASSRPSIASDGRQIAFQSLADNLVPGDTNGVADVFAFNVSTGELRIVSSPSASSLANDASSAPAIAANGSISFTSAATNLVSADTNGADDVFVRLLGEP